MSDLRNTQEADTGSIWLWVLAFSALAVALRLIPYRFPPKDAMLLASFFSAVGALGLFAGARLSGRVAYFIPLGVMLLSDLLLLTVLGSDTFDWMMTPIVYASLTLNVLIGRLLLIRSTPLWVIPASLLTAMQFFLVTNFPCWIGGDGTLYPKTLAGLFQCYVAGLPFFKYGDLIYSVVFFGLYAAFVASTQRQKVSQPA